MIEKKNKMTDEELASQLRELRKKAGITQEELANRLSVTRKTINSYENGASIPNSKAELVRIILKESLIKKNEQLKTLVEDEDKVNAGSLILDNDTEKEEKTSVTVLPAESPVQIPYFDIDFAGGWSSDEIFSTVNPSFYINSPDFHRAEFACNLVGHSISRLIPSGSVIGLRDIQDWQTYFPTNELYGIVMENGLRTVKIVKRNREDKNTLILLPDCLPEYDKTGYEPEEVPISFIVKLYQVTAWAKFQRLTM